MHGRPGAGDTPTYIQTLAIDAVASCRAALPASHKSIRKRAGRQERMTASMAHTSGAPRAETQREERDGVRGLGFRVRLHGWQPCGSSKGHPQAVLSEAGMTGPRAREEPLAHSRTLHVRHRCGLLMRGKARAQRSNVRPGSLGGGPPAVKAHDRDAPVTRRPTCFHSRSRRPFGGGRPPPAAVLPCWLRRVGRPRSAGCCRPVSQVYMACTAGAAPYLLL
jgi:hypothetical protein